MTSVPARPQPGTRAGYPEAEVARDAVIQAQGLTKSYGKNRGILDVTFEVHRGEVFGFLGPNGAGKTTTIRTLMDFIRPTGGAAWIFGLDIGEAGLDIRRRVGYLPGELRLYEHMRSEDLLRFLGNIRGGLDWSEVERLARRLGADLDRRIGELSSGNKQKIGVIQAFMHRPELLILDEPTAGLDPLVQHEFHRLVGEAVTEGRTVFLSSHILRRSRRSVTASASSVKDGWPPSRRSGPSSPGRCVA